MVIEIKHLLRKRGMQFQELAKRLGISDIALRQSLNGNPTYSRLKEIAEALNVEVGELFAPKNDFIAFVRSEGKTHTITSKEELKAFADSINAPKVCQKEAQEANSETTDTERQ